MIICLKVQSKYTSAQHWSIFSGTKEKIEYFLGHELDLTNNTWSLAKWNWCNLSTHKCHHNKMVSCDGWWYKAVFSCLWKCSHTTAHGINLCERYSYADIRWGSVPNILTYEGLRCVICRGHIIFGHVQNCSGYVSVRGVFNI